MAALVSYRSRVKEALIRYAFNTTRQISSAMNSHYYGRLDGSMWEHLRSAYFTCV